MGVSLQTAFLNLLQLLEGLRCEPACYTMFLCVLAKGQVRQAIKSQTAASFHSLMVQSLACVLGSSAWQRTVHQKSVGQTAMPYTVIQCFCVYWHGGR